MVGLAGVGQWTTTANATAVGAYYPPVLGGSVIGIATIWPTDCARS